MGRDAISDGAYKQSEAISIHSPRMGRDHTTGSTTAIAAHFNPLSPHGERRRRSIWPARCSAISIHSPRMGRDRVCIRLEMLNNISIHSPRMGRDFGNICFCNVPQYFNPLSPHGERPVRGPLRWTWPRFQSTLPAWGETVQTVRNRKHQAISIHSPRMGRDAAPVVHGRWIPNFNPLSPHGERLETGGTAGTADRFQSTLPAWGETHRALFVKIVYEFQSTLPAWGETPVGP